MKRYKDTKVLHSPFPAVIKLGFTRGPGIYSDISIVELMEYGLIAANGCGSCWTCVDQTLRAPFEHIIVDLEAEALFSAPAPPTLRGPEGLV